MISLITASLLLCQDFEPLRPREWQKRMNEYQKRASECEETADAHFELGEWVMKQRLEEEAWDQWLAAVALDPDHAGVRKSMGMVKKDGKWVYPGEVNEEWVKKVDEGGRGLEYVVAIADDVDEEFYDGLSIRIRRINRFLWRLTEGQFYLKKITLKDMTRRARWRIPKGMADTKLMGAGGAQCVNAGRENWYLRAGGRANVRIFVHELFHGIFGLPDERAGCPCLMQGGLYGITLAEIKICDEDSHKEERRIPGCCWDKIIERFPKVVHPNKEDFGRAPDAKIVIVDSREEEEY